VNRVVFQQMCEGSRIGEIVTNGLAPIAKVVHENFGIEHGFMTTVHA
jgi:Glyceraldehyde 3-phosphate dehydrogenase, C-terminal domain